LHVDVYESTKNPGPYLLVRRGAGRMAAPDSIRAGFVPGQLVTRVRIISTDSVVGLNVVEALAAIQRDKYYVAQGPVDFANVVGQRLQTL
jgi:uncharacterized protein YcgL (UPF0745 family)